MPILLPVGLACYGVVVWNNLRTQRDSLYELDDVDLRDLQPRQRASAARLRQLQQQILQEIATASKEVQEFMRPSVAKIKELGHRQIYLLRKLQDLEKYLSRVDVHNWQQERRHLEQKKQATRDEVARAQYDRAIQALDDQMGNYQEIQTGCERIDAQLESIHLSLKNIYGQVVRVKTADVRQATVQFEGVNTMLDDLSGEVDSLTQSMDQVFAHVQVLKQ
jgi:seryl-tRNA synthetase